MSSTKSTKRLQQIRSSRGTQALLDQHSNYLNMCDLNQLFQTISLLLLPFIPILGILAQQYTVLYCKVVYLVQLCLILLIYSNLRFNAFCSCPTKFKINKNNFYKPHCLINIMQAVLGLIVACSWNK